MRVAGGEDTSLFSWLCEYLEGSAVPLRKLEDHLSLCLWVHREDKALCVCYSALEGCTMHSLLHLPRTQSLECSLRVGGRWSKMQSQGEGLKGRCEGLHKAERPHVGLGPGHGTEAAPFLLPAGLE